MPLGRRAAENLGFVSDTSLRDGRSRRGVDHEGSIRLGQKFDDKLAGSVAGKSSQILCFGLRSKVVMGR